MGSGFWFGLLFLVLHLALCGALWLLARSRALEVEGYFLPVALLVPVWGPLCVVLLHTSHRLTGGQLLDQTLKKLRINEEIYKNILVVENEEKDTVLTDDPAGYYDLLQQARMDDDSEVVHYASTALAQISKEADLKLQQQEQRYAAAPGDAKVLEEYCDYLESYLDGGFVQGKAAEIQRHQLEQLLKKRLDALGRRSYTLECKLAAAQLALAEYDRAEATLDALTARWPQRETPWLLHLRMAAALRDGAAIQKTLHDIEEKEVYLSAKGRETVRFWQGKNA